MYSAFNGVISPLDTVAFLRGSGEMAKTLSDDGLKMMLIALLEQKKQAGNGAEDHFNDVFNKAHPECKDWRTRKGLPDYCY